MIEEIKVAAGVLEILHERGALDKIWDFLTQKKPTDVIIMGASGTGKTAILKQLSGQEPFIYRHDRSPDVEIQKGSIQNSNFILKTTPGQRTAVHSNNRKAAIREAAGSNNLGIINVVSYGYHEGPVQNLERVFENGKVRNQYLEEMRQHELDLLPEWSQSLCGPGGTAKWLITIITKADIWWGTEHQDLVSDHYHDGAYMEALGHAANLPHSVLNYSPLNQKFYGILASSGEYEDAQRRSDHNRIVATMIEYATK